MDKHRHAPRTLPVPAAPDRLVTLRETCEILTISRTTLYRLGQTGALPIVRITPTRAAVRQRDITKFIDARVGHSPQEGA